jgi:hypothetical protein
MITLAIVAVVAAPGSFAAANDNNQPFTITISTAQGTVKANEEIRVRVVLTNVSNQDLPVRFSRNPREAELHYAVSVHDKSGKEVAETKYGSTARKHQMIGLSEAATLLKPGEQLEEYAILDNMFDLKSMGEYEVQLSRPVSTDPKDGVVKSNKITIIVTE